MPNLNNKPLQKFKYFLSHPAEFIKLPDEAFNELCKLTDKDGTLLIHAFFALSGSKELKKTLVNRLAVSGKLFDVMSLEHPKEGGNTINLIAHQTELAQLVIEKLKSIPDSFHLWEKSDKDGFTGWTMYFLHETNKEKQEILIALHRAAIKTAFTKALAQGGHKQAPIFFSDILALELTRSSGVAEKLLPPLDSAADIMVFLNMPIQILHHPLTGIVEKMPIGTALALQNLTLLEALLSDLNQKAPNNDLSDFVLTLAQAECKNIPGIRHIIDYSALLDLHLLDHPEKLGRLLSLLSPTTRQSLIQKINSGIFPSLFLTVDGNKLSKRPQEGAFDVSNLNLYLLGLSRSETKASNQSQFLYRLGYLQSLVEAAESTPFMKGIAAQLLTNCLKPTLSTTTKAERKEQDLANTELFRLIVEAAAFDDEETQIAFFRNNILLHIPSPLVKQIQKNAYLFPEGVLNESKDFHNANIGARSALPPRAANFLTRYTYRLLNEEPLELEASSEEVALVAGYVKDKNYPMLYDYLDKHRSQNIASLMSQIVAASGTILLETISNDASLFNVLRLFSTQTVNELYGMRQKADIVFTSRPLVRYSRGFHNGSALEFWMDGLKVSKESTTPLADFQNNVDKYFRLGFIQARLHKLDDKLLRIAASLLREMSLRNNPVMPILEDCAKLLLAGSEPTSDKCSIGQQFAKMIMRYEQDGHLPTRDFAWKIASEFGAELSEVRSADKTLRVGPIHI